MCEHGLTLGSRSVASFHGDLVATRDRRRSATASRILLGLLALSLALEVVLEDLLSSRLLVVLALLNLSLFLTIKKTKTK